MSLLEPSKSGQDTQLERVRSIFHRQLKVRIPGAKPGLKDKRELLHLTSLNHRVYGGLKRVSGYGI
jgi:hypothetical protein